MKKNDKQTEFLFETEEKKTFAKLIFPKLITEKKTLELIDLYSIKKLDESFEQGYLAPFLGGQSTPVGPDKPPPPLGISGQSCSGPFNTPSIYDAVKYNTPILGYGIVLVVHENNLSFSAIDKIVYDFLIEEDPNESFFDKVDYIGQEKIDVYKTTFIRITSESPHPSLFPLSLGSEIPKKTIKVNI